MDSTTAADPTQYRSDRDLMAAAYPPVSDLEWLEIQADAYRALGRRGQDVARLAADALAGAAARLAASGCWDAADLYALQRDDDRIDALAAEAEAAA